MPLISKIKKTKEGDKALIKKATTAKKPKRTNNISTAISSMVTNAETKLGKYRNKFQVIRDEKELEIYMEGIQETGICAIDTETTGLDVFTVDIVGICLYAKGLKPAYIPLTHRSYITGELAPNQMPKSVVKAHFEALTGIKWVMHNSDYDIRILKHTMGLYLECYWDTQHAARMLNENDIEGDKPYSLKWQHLKHCKSTDSEALSFNSLFNGVTFDNIPINTAYLYAAGDAIKTYELYEYQLGEMQKPGMAGVFDVFMNIEMKIVPVVVEMEDTGIEVDFEVANDLIKRYNEKREAAAEKCGKVLGRLSSDINNYKMRNPNNKLSNPVNLSSPTQLAILLYDVIGIEPVSKKTPRGTGEEILSQLAKEGYCKDLCEAILEMRGIEKLLSTYIEKMPKLAERDGRVHCRFNQLGTKTGRFSSSDPNMQNIPSHNKEIRQMFKAADGYKLISADYSKQEVFIAASVSGDKAFIESCKNSLKNNTDIYSEIAAMIYDVPYEECCEFRKDGSKNDAGKERRGNAKAIVLGVLYSKEVPSIATDLGITKEKAQKIYDGVLKAFPALKTFMEQSQEDARTKGFVETAWGRRRRLPDMQLKEFEFSLVDGTPADFDPLSFEPVAISTEVPKKLQTEYTKKMRAAFGWKKRDAVIAEAKARGIIIKNNGGFIAQATRQCVNSRVQGSAGDVTKVAMILIHNDEKLKELGAKLLLTIHDEVLVEAPEKHIEEVGNRLVELMKQAGAQRITVPMKVDLEVTDNWYGK